MCFEPDFDLPETLIETMRKLHHCPENSTLNITMDPTSETLVNKVAEQTGFSTAAVASALLNEGIAALRAKGILF